MGRDKEIAMKEKAMKKPIKATLDAMTKKLVGFKVKPVLREAPKTPKKPK